MPATRREDHSASPAWAEREASSMSATMTNGYAISVAVRTATDAGYV